jgi:UTP-glucose-1-phosphate uridylyltransferase
MFDISYLTPQALVNHEKVLAISGEPLEDSLKEDVEATLALSKVTKVTAVLMHHFARCTDVGELRGYVQAEIRELRAASVKEKEVLHPFLHQRVVQALAMRA